MKTITHALLLVALTVASHNSILITHISNQKVGSLQFLRCLQVVGSDL